MSSSLTTDGYHITVETIHSVAIMSESHRWV